MAQMRHEWVKLKGKRRGKPMRGLRCLKCENRLFLVIQEPVKRQARTRTAHHLHVVANCPICKGVRRLKLGPQVGSRERMLIVGITEVTALVGAVVGTAGFVLGIINYLRDRRKVTVILLWDMAEALPGANNKTWGLVIVRNVGRRPVYISHASLKLPRGYEETHLVLAEGVVGNRLGEGDPPATYRVDPAGMEKYARDWHKIRAVVYDSTNKEYRSPRPDKTRRPSWAKK